MVADSWGNSHGRVDIKVDTSSGHSGHQEISGMGPVIPSLEMLGPGLCTPHLPRVLPRGARGRQ